MAHVGLIDKLNEAILGMAVPAMRHAIVTIDQPMGALSAKESELIQAAATHRRTEFTAGRHCAKRALDELGLRTAEILSDAEGVPIWPEGTVGSITHSRGVVAAGVVTVGEVQALGLDIERTNRLSCAAMKRVVHPLEESFVQDDQMKASILFSLKEAFYKAQYPLWRTAGNFSDLALLVDLQSGVAKTTYRSPHFADELNAAEFAFRLVGDYVVSACWLSSSCDSV